MAGVSTAAAPMQEYFNRGGWPGDVWKGVSILRNYRPDPTIMAFDAPLTGLSVVTNLDPQNAVLQDHYDEIINDWMAADAAEGMV